MGYCSKDTANGNKIIHDIEVTDDVLTSRGGLSLFVRYLRGIDVYRYLEELFGNIRRSGKGLPIAEVFKQVFCFFLDGTSRHLVYFDTLKEDEGYARSIEYEPDKMIPSSWGEAVFRGIHGTSDLFVSADFAAVVFVAPSDYKAGIDHAGAGHDGDG